MGALRIDSSSLPDISTPSKDFCESSFFRHGRSHMSQLPTPMAVRKKGEPGRLKVVKFEEINLVVKFGPPSVVRLEEAQVMIALRKAFSMEEIIIPEVFGWRVDQGENFIYMSLIRGMTLGEGWQSLTHADKESIRDQFSRIVMALRRLTPELSDLYVGSINGGAVQDIYFRAGNEAGPFHSVKEFNDCVQSTVFSRFPTSNGFEDPYRELLRDASKIYFTHGDLNLYNVIISGDPGSQRIVGLIDWEQAGWYPEYWEYCKALIAVPWMHEWRSSDLVNKALAPYPDEWTAFEQYWMWLCP